jgi:MFS family permease
MNKPHVASLPGGFIAQNVGWRWTIIVPSILVSVCWVLIVVALPETLYVRGLPKRVESTRRGKYHRMRVTGTRAAGRKLQLIDFARPFQMFVCPFCIRSEKIKSHPRLKYFPIVVLGWFAGALV